MRFLWLFAACFSSLAHTARASRAQLSVPSAAETAEMEVQPRVFIPFDTMAYTFFLDKEGPTPDQAWE